ncbi:type IV secretion system DNA-binding domain-containing protein [bacterium]|nr:type IV secretion system DNA-binding domain-containing protein [bacterium]
MLEFIGFIFILLALGIFTYFGIKIYFARLSENFQKKISSNWVFFLVRVPKEQKLKEGEQPKQPQELIAVFEQFLATLYSVYKKDLKTQITGQPHFSLEITAKEDEIGFYLATLSEYANQVEKQIYAFYPAAEIEQISIKDYRLFLEPPKALALAEIDLSKNFPLPINTYLQVEADPLNGLTNPLTKVAKTQKALIQIVVRPADDRWRLECEEAAKKLMEGKTLADFHPKWIKQTSKFTGFLKELWETFKSQPQKENEEQESKLSPLYEEQIKAIQEKASKPGFEVQTRVLATGDSETEAATNLRLILSGFSLFGSPEKNSFKIKIAKNLKQKRQLLKDIVLRFFDPKQKKMILNSEEIASFYHFPNQFIETPHIKWLLYKQAPPPANLPQQGTILGEAVFRGQRKKVFIKEKDRLRHIYCIGKTGTGKTTLLEGMIMDDIKKGKGVGVLDPHGDLAEKLLSKLPDNRIKDVIYFDPGGNTEKPLGFNLLEWKKPEERDFLVQEAIAIFYKIFDPTRQGFIGPQFEHWMRNAALTLMEQPGGGSLIEIPALFTDQNFKNQCIKNLKDPVVKAFWEKQMAQTADFHKSEMLNYFISKFGRFMTNDMLRNVIGQKKSSFDIRQIMDEGKIFIANLSKGKMGEINSAMVGMILISKIQMAAMSRAEIPEEQRRDFYLYVDEFQNFVTDSFVQILSEARKYRLALTIANQYVAQLDEQIRDAVFGNAGTLISFRIGAQEAEFIAKEFEPVFDEFDLTNIDKFHAYIRMIIDNMPQRPFSMQTVVENTPQSKEKAEKIKQWVAETYGQPKEEVEKETTAFVKTLNPNPLEGTREQAPGI